MDVFDKLIEGHTSEEVEEMVKIKWYSFGKELPTLHHFMELTYSIL